MRYLIFLALVLFLLLPACERVNPPADRHDAGPAQPFDDGGSATDGGASLDARTPRPGAGPLDPDLTIDCVTSSTYRATLDAATGHETIRTYPGRAVWTESEEPSRTWLCYDTPYDQFSCGTSTNCVVRGTETWATKCYEVTWQIGTDGSRMIGCGGKSEYDYDLDGMYNVVETGMYIAIVR